MIKALGNSLRSVGRLLGVGGGAPAASSSPFIPVTERLIIESRKREPIDELSLIPRYPPFDHGLPFIRVESVLQTQKEMLGRIKLQAGVHDSEYLRLFEPVLHNYALYVHLLPATKDDYFRGAGGLLRMGLEIGFFALQSAGGVVFTGREPAGQRRIKEPRWQFLTFVAGLCYGIDRVLSQMIITTEDGEQWPCYTSTLFEWLENKGAKRYFITWLDPNNALPAVQSASSYVLHRIVPEECLQYIAQAGNDLVSVLMSVLSNGTARGYGDRVYEIVSKTTISVIERDRKADPAKYGQVLLGTHLERYIIDAIRKLIKTQWFVNQKRARCWYSNEGVFLIWQSGAKDVWHLLQQQRLPGVPEAPETLAEIMVASGMILPAKDGSPYWTIYPPNSSSPEGYKAVKFKSKELIFDHVLLHGADASDGVGKQNPVAPIASSLLTRQTASATASAAAKKSALGRLVPPTAGVPPVGTTPAPSGVAVANGTPVDGVAPEGVAVPAAAAQASIVGHEGTNTAISHEVPPDLFEGMQLEAAQVTASVALSSPGTTAGIEDPGRGNGQSDAPPDFSDVLQDADQCDDPAGQADFGLRTDTARLLLEAIRDDFNAGRTEGSVFVVDTGLAITAMEIARRGIAKPILDEWLACGILLANARGTSLHKLQRGSETVTLAVIRPEYARRWKFCC
ncbi:MobH family relaxase [Duganella vulcania]|uniref:Uncharacterized domain-containing protein n=1 Tax=Duganella vulcania TaxID=2692166 RepID=A0A845GH46_9BURK|nr:MobH family relaxase [Duganella vulcania]MYM92725.1 hypothetical protein [Duganella vulcania]